MRRGFVLKGLLVLCGALSFTVTIFAQGATGGGTGGGCGGVAPHLEFIGTLHQLREGEADDSSDWITPINYGGQPICLTRNADLKITWFDENPEVEWKVLSATLICKKGSHVIWSLAEPSEFMLVGTEYDLPGDMPNYVLPGKLEIEIVTYTGLLGEGEPPPELPILVGSDSVFVVLNTPKAPMAPAWVNVLAWATAAAAHSSDEFTAAQSALHQMFDTFTYDYDYIWWTVTSGANETFYAKRFFDAKKGQCNDFADGLTTACSALGISGYVPTRSAPNVSSNKRIFTDPIDPAGIYKPIGPKIFRYHQFVLKSSKVWDSAVQLDPNTNAWVIDYSLASYELDLVDFYFIDISPTGYNGETKHYPPDSSFFSPTTVNLTLSAANGPP